MMESYGIWRQQLKYYWATARLILFNTGLVCTCQCSMFGGGSLFFWTHCRWFHLSNFIIHYHRWEAKNRRFVQFLFLLGGARLPTVHDQSWPNLAASRILTTHVNDKTLRELLCSRTNKGDTDRFVNNNSELRLDNSVIVETLHWCHVRSGTRVALSSKKLSK